MGRCLQSFGVPANFEVVPSFVTRFRSSFGCAIGQWDLTTH
jgi:hypothetical protein